MAKSILSALVKMAVSYVGASVLTGWEWGSAANVSASHMFPVTILL